MDSPPKLTGETLIVHHIPLVHCQVPDRQCCSVSKRTNPFCQPELNITRTSALPDRDLSQTDSLVYSSFLQTSETSAEASDNKEGKARDLIVPGVSKRHNPFLLSEGEDLSIFGDDLGQKSFHLHNSLVDGKPPFNLQELALPPFHLHDSNHIVKSWNMASRSGVVDGQEDKISSDDIQKRNNANRCHQASERMELDECSCHRGSSSSFSFDGGDHEWNQNTGESLRNQDALHSRTCSCSSSEIQHCRCYSSSSQSEVIDQQMGYISDSSCNSSDGVLVNFSALYNKMNGQSQSNLNSANLSCDSSFCSHSDTGAFYLDLHSSPTESKMSCESHNPESSGKVCGCQHSSSPVLDANCNSYHLHCEPCTSESSDLTACFQSQARLVVATQNYYKLVTCDLSSQSSPSPAGSSITSCSEDQTKGSPAQPTEYYLFRRPDLRQEEGNVECSEEEAKGESAQNTIEGQVYVNVSPPNLNTSRQRSRSYDQNLDRSPSSRLGSLERMVSCPVKLSESPAIPIQSSPPKRVTSFAELAKGRKKNSTSPPLRSSGDSSLEFSPIPETQRDCPTFLEERARRSQSLPPMPFVHGLNRSCEGFCLNHAFGDSQALCSTKDSVSSEKVPSGHGAGEQASLSLLTEADANFSGGSAGGHGQKDVRARADGGGTDSKPVVRYSKDQRPTTLPIQPFVFQHHFSKPPKARALHSHFASSLSQLYSLSSNRPSSQQISCSQSSALASSAEQAAVAGSQAHGTLVTQRSADGAASRNDGGIKKSAPETTRPSPLGSYSPVRCNVPFFQSVDSSSSPAAERAEDSQPPRSRSCPISANLLPTRSSPAVSAMQPSKTTKADALKQKENPKMIPKKEAPLEPSPPLSEYRLHSASLPPLSVGGMSMSRVGGHADSHWRSGSESSSSGPLSSMGIRPVNANHLSPQALKWREYRRRNPLGLDRVSGLPSLAGSLDRRQQEPRLNRGNPIFELPGALSTSHFHCKLNGQSMRQLQLTYNDFFPDYFSLAEKPPAEFCLSPDGNTESISIDLLQKKSLVKAINTAVDLIVAHFGTSRDPGVKAKLGNSSVSPNVGHLILKYLCPAVRDILSDGLKAYVLDMIIGQRRNIPWSVVEASTQLGPSTKLLHSLYSKISQYTELTNHTMRFNAFIFGLLNIRSLEFWFNHLYNHEDIILAHYQPVGFLCLSHSVCQPLFEELLLLLQPLSLLPFNLDLLFEHHLMQMGKEQQQQKELLRVKQDLLLSVHSTLQLMRTRGSSEDPDGCSTAPETCQGGARDGDISPGHSPQQAVSEKRVKGVGASCGDGDREEERNKMQESTWERKKDKQAGWWYQLMQTSQIYIEGSAEGSKFIRSEKKKAALNTAPKSVETHKAPPPREGVVEGAEACPIAEGSLEERPKAASKPSPEAVEEPLEKPQQVVVSEEVKERSWPFWMGSPPDSVLSELKRSKEKETGTQQRVGAAAAAPQEDSSTSASEGSQAIKWGHLFGSRKVQKEPRQPNRLPSGWLSLDKSVFQLVAQTVGASMWREAAPEPDPPQPETPEVPTAALPAQGMSSHPTCEVKALCHHIATEAGQLSFNKGDILQVISKVDGDWLQCSLGSEKGLVPIMYVTHPEDEDY